MKTMKGVNMKTMKDAVTHVTDTIKRYGLDKKAHCLYVASGKLAIVTDYEQGYRPLEFSYEGDYDESFLEILADAYNETIGLNKEQAMVFVGRNMFSFKGKYKSKRSQYDN